MASFTELVDQAIMKVPIDKRAQERSGVENLVLGAIEATASISKWEWRETYEDVSLVLGTTTYSLPTDCDFISRKQGFFVDSSGNPTKNRLIVIDEDTYNQKYIDDVGTEGTQVAANPLYIVTLTQRSSTGAIQFRAYPAPDTSYTARVYYFTKPNDSDAAKMISSLILYNVYSNMPIEWVGDPTYWDRRFDKLLAQLKPMDTKSSAGKPVLTQDIRVARTMARIRSGGARR